MRRGFFRRLASMCDAAFFVLLGTLRVSCAMLLCSFSLLVHIGELTPANYNLYRTAVELAVSPAGLLLLAVIVSVIMEEKSLG